MKFPGYRFSLEELYLLKISSNERLELIPQNN